tara:strand:+ start:6120 stop:7451 length:1332 start_codon:yes stop_codon:yes gene_type:complete
LSNFINKYLIGIVIGFHITLYFTSIFIFKTNIPWVDDWQWIENLQTNEISTYKWLLKLENIHNHFTVKLILLFSKFYLNFNFQFFSYLSITLLFSSSILLYRNLASQNISIFFISLLLVILFSSKQFPSISQMSNLSWFICFFLIILYYSVFNLEKIKISKIICLIFSPLTLGFGVLLPLYTILLVVIKYNFSKSHLLYFVTSILSLIFAFIIPRLISNEIDSAISYNFFDNLSYIIIFKIIFTFFALLGSLCLPWIEKINILAFCIGFLQFAFLFSYLFLKINKSRRKIKSLILFFEDNMLIILGLLFALVVSLSRAEWNTSIQPRYSTGVIIFYIGYFLYFYKEFKSKNIFYLFQNITSLYVILIFLVGNFSPYLGLHWQVTKSFNSNRVIECFVMNEKIDDCISIAYNVLFYEGKWYDYNKFSEQIYILKNKKEIFFIDK